MIRKTFFVAALLTFSAPSAQHGLSAQDGLLPADLAPGRASVVLSVDGQSVELDFPGSWSGREVRLFPLSGVTVTLRGEPPLRGEVTVLDLRPRSDPDLSVSAKMTFSQFQRARPGRFSSRGRPSVRHLSVGQGGFNFARGFYDPALDRGFDLDGIARTLRLQLQRGDEDLAVTVKGAIPRGRETAVLSWQEEAGRLGGRSEVRQARAASVFRDGGWLLERDAGRVRQISAKLSQESPYAGFFEAGDGWQSSSSSTLFRGPMREWTKGPTRAFPEGLSAVVPAVSKVSHGFGVWMTPFGHDEEKRREENEDRSAAPDSSSGFVIDDQAELLSDRFLGARVADPTSEDGLRVIREATARVASSGVSHITIGGLEPAHRYYARHRRFLSDSQVAADQSIERSMSAVREGAQETLIIGEGRVPPSAWSALDALRPTWVFARGTSPFLQEVRAFNEYLHLHRWQLWVAPIPVRRWASQGSPSERHAPDQFRLFSELTGRRAILTDALPMRSGSPTALADVWPLDMSSASSKESESITPNVWVVHVADGSADYEYGVVGFFRWRDREPIARCSTRELALGRERELLVYDLKNRRLIYEGQGPVDVQLRPGETSALAVHPDLSRPQILAARSALAEDEAVAEVMGLSTRLRDVQWDEVLMTLSGELVDPAGATWVHVRVPDGFRMKAGVDQEVRLTTSPWSIEFVRDASRRDRSIALAEGITFDSLLSCPILRWNSGERSRVHVYRDGRWIGSTIGSSFLDESLGELNSATYSLLFESRLESSRWIRLQLRDDERTHGELKFQRPMQPRWELAEQIPNAQHSAEAPAAFGSSATGGRLRVRGVVHDQGIGVYGDHSLTYSLGARFKSFETKIAVDDAAALGAQLQFVVLGDGAELFRSATMTGLESGPTEVSLSVEGIKTLTLKVDSLGRADNDYANWLEPRVLSAVPE